MRSARYYLIAILFSASVNTVIAQQVAQEPSAVAEQELLTLIAQLGDDDFD